MSGHQARVWKPRSRGEIDAQRNARTRAVYRVAIAEGLKVHELEETTRDGYEMCARNYLNPALGDEPVSKISARVLEQFHAELRRCRARCGGRASIDHRVDGPHECRVVRHKRTPGRPPAGGYPEHDCAQTECTVKECPPHTCRPLSNATISKVHFIIRGALAAAVRWDWIASNPAEVARKPRQPTPQPKPPTPEQAGKRARLSRPRGSRTPTGARWSGS